MAPTTGTSTEKLSPPKRSSGWKLQRGVVKDPPEKERVTGEPEGTWEKST
jgi:hypothetical protein